MEHAKLSYDRTKRFVLDLIDNFSDIYFSHIQSSIFSHFYLKEMLSDDYINTLYKKLGEAADRQSLAEQMSASLSFSSELENTTDDEKIEILNLFYDKIISHPEYFKIDLHNACVCSLCYTVIDPIFRHFKDSDKLSIAIDDFLDRIADTRDGKQQLSDLEIKTILDDIFSYDKITNPMKIVKKVQDNYHVYKDFPLVALNLSMSDEDRIEVIQKTNKLTDMNALKEYYLKCGISANGVDILIRAFEGNHTKEKTKVSGIIKWLNWAFIAPNSNRHYETLRTVAYSNTFKHNVKKFLCTGDNSSRFYIETVSSKINNNQRQLNYKDFLERLYYSNGDYKENLKEVVDLLPTRPEFACLTEYSMFNFNSIINELDNRTASDEDKEIYRKALDIYIKWSNKDNNYSFINSIHRETFIHQLINSSDSLKNLFSGMKLFYRAEDKTATYSYNALLSSTRDFICDAEFLNYANINIIRNLDPITPEEVVSGGFTVENVKSTEKQYSPNTSLRFMSYNLKTIFYSINDFKTMVKTFTQRLVGTNYNENNREEILQILFNRFCKYFEDDGLVRIGIGNISNIIGMVNDYLKRCNLEKNYKFIDSAYNLEYVLKETYKNIDDAAKCICDSLGNQKDYDVIHNNISKCLSSIELFEETDE